LPARCSIWFERATKSAFLDIVVAFRWATIDCQWVANLVVPVYWAFAAMAPNLAVVASNRAWFRTAWTWCRWSR